MPAQIVYCRYPVFFTKCLFIDALLFGLLFYIFDHLLQIIFNHGGRNFKRIFFKKFIDKTLLKYLLAAVRYIKFNIFTHSLFELTQIFNILIIKIIYEIVIELRNFFFFNLGYLDFQGSNLWLAFFTCRVSGNFFPYYPFFPFANPFQL